MDVDNLSPRSVRGITLVELITTLAVAGISLAVLVPSWAAFADRSQITAAANGLLTDLRFARSTAVTRNRRIGLCPSDNGQRCSGDPRGWQRGYIVFADTDADRDRDPGETILRVKNALSQPLKLHSTAGRPVISFRPDGGAWSTNTTFSVCAGDNRENYRTVVLYGSGRARVNRRGPNNRPVRCL